MSYLPDPPCTHLAFQIGTISAGNVDGGGNFCSVPTCSDCLTACVEYVYALTGLPVNPPQWFKGISG